MKRTGTRTYMCFSISIWAQIWSVSHSVRAGAEQAMGCFLFKNEQSTSLAEKFSSLDLELKPWQPFWECVLPDKLGQSREATQHSGCAPAGWERGSQVGAPPCLTTPSGQRVLGEQAPGLGSPGWRES